MSANQSLESLRWQAKQLLKSARSGDAVVIDRLRALLPRLASFSNDAVTSAIKLADVQHAMARRAGQASWRDLTRMLEHLDPLHLHAARFLKAVRDEHVSVAAGIFEAHPALRHYSIHTATAVADPETVNAFLAADPASATRSTQPDDTEPMVYAVVQGIKDALSVSESARFDTVRQLLDAGASANASVPPGDAPSRIPVLYFPCVVNNVAIARLLLERGAQVNDGEGLYHAAQHNHRECLEVLREFGADLSSRHASFGNTPLYFLATHRESNPLTAKATLGMQWLLEHGADPNVPSSIAPSRVAVPDALELPLHRIAAAGRGAEVACMLVAHGAVVDAPRGDGRTAYAMAVRVGNTGTADYLASVGADITHVPMVDRLLGACARADEGEAHAIVSANPDIVSLLSAEDRQELGVAIGDNRHATVQLMLSLGWSLVDEGEWGGTPLHWAAWHGRLSLVCALLARGAPINVRDSQYGSSPIAWAAHGSTNAGHDHDGDYVAIVNLLLDAGATRTESHNRWNESPESMASPAVAGALKVRGFAV